VSSTSWFVAVASIGAIAMTLWIVLDWLSRVNERPFRPRRESVSYTSKRPKPEQHKQADVVAASPTQNARGRSGATLRTRDGEQLQVGAELDFDYIEQLRSPVGAVASTGPGNPSEPGDREHEAP
jgi:hypothetical protein